MALLTDEEWESFKSKFGKSYTDADEEGKRRNLVEKAKQFIDEHNKKYEAGESTFCCALNDFADKTPEEKSRYLGCRMPTSKD